MSFFAYKDNVILLTGAFSAEKELLALDTRASLYAQLIDVVQDMKDKHGKIDKSYDLSYTRYLRVVKFHGKKALDDANLISMPGKWAYKLTRAQWEERDDFDVETIPVTLVCRCGTTERGATEGSSELISSIYVCWKDRNHRIDFLFADFTPLELIEIIKLKAASEEGTVK